MSNLSIPTRAETTLPSMRQILGPLTAIIVGMFMVVLDNSALNVVVPHLRQDFSASYHTVQWAITGYALAQAAVIPLSGWMSDRIGAKRVFLASVAMFSMGSLLCALANNIDTLVIFRILQGLGGGMVAPIGFAFTFRLSPPSKVGTVMSIMSIPILLAPALGPVLSGWLVDYISWHWIFFINVPVGVVGVLIGLRTLPNLERQSGAPLDVVGMVLAPLGFVSLSYGVTEGSMSWTSLPTIGGLSVGIIAMVLFVVSQLRHQYPLMEIRAFQSGSFTRGIVVLWITQFAFFGTIFLIPQYLQTVKDYSAFDAGLCMLPYALTTAVLNQISGRLFDRFGARWLAVIGIACLAAAAFLFSRVPPHAGFGAIVGPIVLLGASLGLSIMPITSHVLKAAPQHLIGRVTSLTSAMQQVMVSFSVAGLTTALTTKDHMFSVVFPASPATAWSDAFRATFLIIVGIALAGFILSFMLGRTNTDGVRPAGMNGAFE
jgi:EmrB/QacA subfamily drug resistance transporter